MPPEDDLLTESRNPLSEAIDTLELAILACPESMWQDDSLQPQPWYLAYHTLFWLDFRLSDLMEETTFAPPQPFTVSEFDDAGLMPERVYSREELLAYLAHGRERCRTRLRELTLPEARRMIRCAPRELSVAEWLLYNLRHVQHHAAQLNLLLRQHVDSSPRWVSRTGQAL